MTNTTNTAPTATFIVHCKRCKVSRKFTATEVSRRGHTVGYSCKRTAYDKTYDMAPAAPFALGTGQTGTEYHDRPGSVWISCPCGRHCEAQKIIGRHSEHKCSAKCQNSHSHICECSCGGVNHGASWGA